MTCMLNILQRMDMIQVFKYDHDGDVIMGSGYEITLDDYFNGVTEEVDSDEEDDV